MNEAARSILSIKTTERQSAFRRKRNHQRQQAAIDFKTRNQPISQPSTANDEFHFISATHVIKTVAVLLKSKGDH